MPTKILLWQTDNSATATNAEKFLSALSPWACFGGFDVLLGNISQMEQHCRNEKYSIILVAGDDCKEAVEAGRITIPESIFVEVSRSVDIQWDGSQFPRDWLLDPQLVKAFFCCINPNRASGAKYFLHPGSTIFYNTLYSASGVGSRLDPCHAYMHDELGAERGLKAWAAIYSLALMGLMEGSVELQFGADDLQVWVTAALPLNQDRESKSVLDFMNRQELKLISTLANAVDCRIVESVKLEIAVGFWKKDLASLPSLNLLHQQDKEALEDEEYSKLFTYKHLKDAQNKNKESFGFQKNNDSSQANNASISAGNNAELLQQIEALKESIKMRDEMIQKLNKEVADAKNPEKWNVINAIQDTKVEALKDTIEKQKQDIAFIEKEKKQLLALADQAVSAKDEIQKQFRDQTTKFRQLQENFQTRNTNYEKQIEDLAKQKRDLMKIITQLTEKLKSMSGRGAA